MPLELQQSTQFTINELVLVSKLGSYDIRSIYDEINLYDSIFNPCISANIIIRDSIGLAEKLLLDGSEMVLMKITKDGEELAFKKSFRVYKLSDRKNVNDNSEMYVLHLVSDEFLFSEQQSVNQAFDGSYTEIALAILSSYLQVPTSQLKGYFDPSMGSKSVVMPFLKPLDAIEWCAKRAVDKNSSPNFLFFQNSVGFNFASLSTLLSQKQLFDINFDVKNLSNSVHNEFLGVRDYKILTQFDTITNTRNGVYAGKFLGFDPITRTIASRKLTYFDHYMSMSHGNKTPNYSEIYNRANLKNTQMFDSRAALSYFTESLRYSNYVKEKVPSLVNSLEDTHNNIFQRKCILMNLTNRRIALSMPGNFLLSSGFNVFLKTPKRAVRTKEDDAFDLSVQGKYLIVATRHMIKYDSHETIIEVASSSNEKEGVLPDKVDQALIGVSYDEFAA